MKKIIILMVILIASADCALAENGKVKGPVVKVEQVGGAPTFIVDGKPFTIPCSETYHPEYKYFQQFADAGVQMFSFNVSPAACDYGHSVPIWVDANTWDYTQFDERMDRVLKANPNALVLPRVNLGTPVWWLKANPQELEVYDTGDNYFHTTKPTHFVRNSFPSLVSEKWRKDTGEALRRFIEYAQNSKYADHIIGYFLVGLHTEEWYHWGAGYDELPGYSVHMEKAFRVWLKDKYGTDAKLQAAWNRKDINIDRMKVPTKAERMDGAEGTFRDPAAKMNVIDFYLFYNDTIPETIDYFAKITRDLTEGKKIIGAFYAYMYEFRGDPEYGHNALGKYINSPNLDFVFVTASYGNRVLGVGGDYQRAPAYSVQLHNKLWYHDNDVVSFLGEKVMRRPKPALYMFPEKDIPFTLKALAATKTPEETQFMYRRSLGFSICNGFFESFFDLHGGYYDDPNLMAEVARLVKIADESKNYDRSSIAEILIVSDEPSCSYFTFRNPYLTEVMSQTQQELIKLGTHTDHILTTDLDRIKADRYKLIIMLNCPQLNDAQRKHIKDKFEKGGKTIVWIYAQGLFNENKTSVEAMEELTGLKILPAQSADLIAPRIELADADYGLNKNIKDCKPVLGPEGKLCRLYSVKDNSAKTLGVLPGTKDVTMAIKDMGTWKSIYMITPNVSPAAWREIAKEAGVHIFNDRDDTFYVNKSFMTIHANGAGERIIKFPTACEAFDMVAQKPVELKDNSFTYDFKNGETLILRWSVKK